MRQRRRLNASRKAGLVSIPSALALMFEKPTLRSLAQNGTSPQRMTSRLRCPALASWRTMGRSSVGAAFQLAGMLGVGRSGGIEKTSLISLTSEERRARPHIGDKWRTAPMPTMLSLLLTGPSRCRPASLSLPEHLGEERMTTADDTYDFIVTGAGSAGCAVAGRLSESGRWRVLLLEAGGRDSNPWIHIPLGYTKTFANPRYNWMFESEPEKELNDRTLYQPRGKVLGGTSSINGMVYMRGTPTDYDGWRQRGCEGWDWDSVLPFFKKAEDQERGADDFHGVGGPLHVSNPVRTPLGDAMVAASIEAGIPANPDFNGARQEGVGYYQTTTTNRRRWSSARAYL